MSTLEKGTKVKIISGELGSENEYHYFKLGDIVEFAYQDAFGDRFRGFIDGEADLQWLDPEHYEIIKQDEPVKPVLVEGGIPEVALPSKVIYGIVNAADEIYATHEDRDYARELKSALGGKRKGIRIFQYAAVKEIR